MPEIYKTLPVFVRNLALEALGARPIILNSHMNDLSGSLFSWKFVTDTDKLSFFFHDPCTTVILLAPYNIIRIGLNDVKVAQDRSLCKRVITY